MIVKPFVRLVSAVLITAAASCAPAASRTTVTPAGTGGADAIHILHFNDVYEITPVEAGKSGGLARVAALRRALRDSFPALVTTLGGDFVSPSAIGTARVGGERLNGRQMVDVLNAVGLDIAVLGNHEFDVSRDAFLARMNEARFTVIAANVADSAGRPFAKVAPHAIRKVRAGGREVRVAFLGVVIPSNRPSWSRVTDPLEAARREAGLLRDSADVLVALTHLSVDDDARLLAENPDVDVVLGGHEHENYTLRRGPRFAPIIKGDANVRSVQIVTIAPPAGGRRAEVTSRLLPIVEGMSEDTSVSRVVARWVDTAYAGFQRDGFRPRELVATTPIALDGREATVRTTSSSLTELIGAAMRRDVTDAELSIFNSGAIRIDDVVPPGPVTQYDVIRMLPFGGKTVEVRMRGELLSRVLTAGDRNVGRGGFLQRTGVAGDAAAGWQINGAPLDLERMYRVAISDYLMTGAEVGIEFLKADAPGVQVVGDRRDIRQAVIEQMRSQWK
ncbi:MAG TPA: bifunctional metallophosphatase/5'-nucleotidase [Gemmatimonadaceae bacterium]|nr:bifunctional metallophosphatase/5'-nucleotidase [Gemmatimonadaceae bacterium]